MRLLAYGAYFVDILRIYHCVIFSLSICKLCLCNHSAYRADMLDTASQSFGYGRLRCLFIFCFAKAEPSSLVFAYVRICFANAVTRRRCRLYMILLSKIHKSSYAIFDTLSHLQALLANAYILSTVSMPKSPRAVFITFVAASTIARRAFLISISTSSFIIGFVL